MNPGACLDVAAYQDGLTVEQLSEMMQWVNALTLPPGAVRVVLALAKLVGFACEGRGQQRLYRKEIAACVAWPDIPSQHRIAIARISCLTTLLAKRGYIRKVLDLSECERDEAGNIISHAGAFCRYELLRAPGPREEPLEPAPREKRERPEPPGRPCPKGHKSTRKLYTTYQCLECGLTFTDKGAEAVEARNAARNERIKRSGLSIVPRPRPPSMAEMLAPPAAPRPLCILPDGSPLFPADWRPYPTAPVDTTGSRSCFLGGGQGARGNNHAPPAGTPGQGREAGEAFTLDGVVSWAGGCSGAPPPRDPGNAAPTAQPAQPAVLHLLPDSRGQGP